jgi:hypothetical protein
MCRNNIFNKRDSTIDEKNRKDKHGMTPSHHKPSFQEAYGTPNKDPWHRFLGRKPPPKNTTSKSSGISFASFKTNTGRGLREPEIGSSIYKVEVGSDPLAKSTAWLADLTCPKPVACLRIEKLDFIYPFHHLLLGNRLNTMIGKTLKSYLT